MRGARRELEAAGVESPGVEAERLVAWAVGEDRSALLRTMDRRLEAAEAGRLARGLGRRQAGEPLQHIEGTVAFRGLTLRCDARALIPRPETEELVDRIAAWAVGRAPLAAALDVGTGSGAIALALVAEGVARRAVGLDVSAEALEQAAENRALAGLDPARLELRHAARPVWSAVTERERFDVIVSNPPYVADAEWARLPPDIRDHEPASALRGGPDGLEVVREVIEGAASRLAPDGALFLEIGAGQAAAVRRLLAASGRWAAVEVGRDLAGRKRFVRAVAAEA